MTACVQLLCTIAQACGKNTGANGVLGTQHAAYSITVIEYPGPCLRYLARHERTCCTSTHILKYSTSMSKTPQGTIVLVFDTDHDHETSLLANDPPPLSGWAWVSLSEAWIILY